MSSRLNHYKYIEGYIVSDVIGKLSNKIREWRSEKPMYEMRNGLRQIVPEEVTRRALSIIKGIGDQIDYIREKMMPDATPGARNYLEDVIDNLEQQIYPYEDVIASPEEASKSPDFFGLFYRFIGEQGAERLDNAQEVTTRIDNLNVAREMEKSGKEVKAIKLATGWERGSDGKWRYETRDFGGINTGKARSGQEAVRLSDVINDKELFAAYPDLGNIGLKFEVLPDSISAQYRADDNTIVVNSNSSETEVRGFLLHEIQHAIQNREGFSRGTSSAEMALRYGKEGFNLPWSFVNESKRVASVVAELPKDLTVEQARKLYESEVSNKGENRMVYANVLGSLSQGSSMSDIVEGYKKEADKMTAAAARQISDKDSAYNSYIRTAGEVEARNVQWRESMTDEERRASLAAETEDVAREDQIFLQDGLGVSEMGSRVPKRRLKVKAQLKDANLTDEQKKIIDVFTGDANSCRMTITGKNGICKLYVRRGNENNAGTDHCLFGHFETTKGAVTAEELTFIPDVIRNGDKGKGKRKGTWEYTLIKDGVEYTVVTAIDKQTEEFNNFYSDREEKAPASGSSNTPNGARTDKTETLDAAKIQNNFGTTKPYTTENDINTTQTTVGHLSQELGVEIVTINDASEAEGYAKATPKRQAEMRKSKGWYDPVTGKIYVVGKQHTSVADVERTVWHEAVGHRGVHGLLGDKFAGFCDRLFKSLDKGMQSALHRTHDRKEPLSDAALGAEYIAEIAEKGEWRSEGERNVWYKTVRWVRQQMMLMGFSFVPTEDDIRYMLYTASKKGNRMRTEQLRQQAVNSHDEMQDAMQMPTLDRPSDAFRSRTAGMTDRDIMTERELAAAVDAMKNASERKATAWQRGMANVVDYMHPVARFMQRLMGVDSVQEAMRSNDYNNAYMKQEAAASKTMDRINRFKANEMAKLAKIKQSLVDT